MTGGVVVKVVTSNLAAIVVAVVVSWALVSYSKQRLKIKSLID